MLIKNIAFSGIMAAIVLSAGAAMADDTATAIQVASPTYVKAGDTAVYNALNNKKQDKIVAGSNITIGADGKTISATVPDVSGFATKSEIAAAKYQTASDVSGAIETATANMATKSSVDGLTESVGALTTALAQKQATLTAGANITIDGNTISATVPDVSNLATKAEVDAATENMVDTTALNTKLADYAKTTDIPTVPANVSAFANDAGYLTTDSDTKYTAGTGVQIDANNNNAISVNTDVIATKNDLSGLATETYVNDKVEGLVAGDMTEALGNYYKKSEVDETLAGYAKTTDVPTVPANVSAFTNDLGYITSSDIAAKADTSTVTALSETVAGKADASTVTALSETVAGKASQSDLDTLTQTVGQKASQSDLTALQNTVNALDIPNVQTVDTYDGEAALDNILGIE